MEIDQILRKLQKIYSEVIGADPSEVTLESNLRDDLGASEIELAEAFSKIEREFDITLPQDQLRKTLSAENMATIGDLVELIQEELE